MATERLAVLLVGLADPRADLPRLQTTASEAVIWAATLADGLRRAKSHPTIEAVVYLRHRIVHGLALPLDVRFELAYDETYLDKGLPEVRLPIWTTAPPDPPQGFEHQSKGREAFRALEGQQVFQTLREVARRLT